MRKLLFILCFVTALISGCSQTDVLDSHSSAALSFDTHIGKSSRAVAVSRFKERDTIGVYMYYTPTDWATDGIGGSEEKMGNTALRFDAGVWMYSPTLFWKQDEKYTFFAYAPYKENAAINNGVLPYSVGADETRQEDLLYSVPSVQTKDKSWDGSATVPDKVQFVFTHALSQVKFSVATEYDYSSLYTIELTDIKLNNIYRTGNLNLISENSVAEPWSGHSVPGSVTYSPAAIILNHVALQPVTNTTGDVWMLLPQTLPADAEVEFTIHLNKVGTMGTATDGDYTLKAPLATGDWEHNKVYNYQVILNMDQILGVKPIVIGEPEIIPWEEEPTQDLEPVLPTVEVTVPEGATENKPNEFSLVKLSGNKQSSSVNLKTIETWTATVEDTPDAATRVAASSWLKLADDASGLNASDSKTGTGSSDFYIYIPSRNGLPDARTASVVVSSVQNPRLKIRINVTQKGAPVSGITVADGTGTMDTGFSVLKESWSGQGALVTLTGSGAWQATSSADWLRLATTASGNGASTTKTGTGSGSFYLYLSAANTSQSADRTATVTITGESSADVQGVITVTQSKVYPALTGSAAEAESGSNQVIMSYMSSGTGIQINNNGSGLPWTISSNQSWLKVATSESGANAATSKTGTNSTTVYAYVSDLAYKSADRTGIITLSREHAKDIVITITQGDFAYVNGVKWARGNLRQNGNGVSQDIPNHAGLKFQYGSLIGIKLVKNYTASAIGFKPSEYSGIPSAWTDMPYMPFTKTITGSYNAIAGTGDICKYLSDKGMIGAPGTVWRMPTSVEEGNKLGEMTQVKYGDWVASTTYLDLVPSGVFIGENASIATDPANPPKGTVFIPAVGFYSYISPDYHLLSLYNRAVINVLSDAYYMGASTSTSPIWKMYLISSISTVAAQNGFSVRCVRIN